MEMNTSSNPTEAIPAEILSSRSHKNFYGHVITGAWFISWAIYIAFGTIKNYWKARAKRQPFISSLWFPQQCYTPWLADYNVCFVALIVQALVAVGWCFEKGHYVVTDNEQYMMLYMGLAVHCLLCSLQRFIAMPFLHVDYLSLLVFNVSAGVVTLNHLDNGHHHNHLEIAGHKHTAKVLFVLGLIAALETAHRNSIKLPFLRAFFTMIIGTWFFHLAFALYSPFEGLPPWNHHSHHLKMVLTACFGAHCLVDLSLLFLLAWVTTKHYMPAASKGVLQQDEACEKLLNGRQL